MADISIEIDHLTKVFKAGLHKRIVLQDVSASFGPGQVHIIKGESGAGKSTLLSILGLLDVPSKGRVIFGKEYLPRNERKKREWFRERYVSFLTSDANFIPGLTSLENLRLVCQDDNENEGILSSLGIVAQKDSLAGNLSKGQGIRLGLARVFAEDKPIMLLDEPTANLDSNNLDRFVRLLEEKSQGRTIIIATNDERLLSVLPDYDLYDIEAGHMTHRGSDSEPKAEGESVVSGKEPLKLTRNNFLAIIKAFERNGFLRDTLSSLFLAVLLFLFALNIEIGNVSPLSAIGQIYANEGSPYLVFRTSSLTSVKTVPGWTLRSHYFDISQGTDSGVSTLAAYSYDDKVLDAMGSSSHIEKGEAFVYSSTADYLDLTVGTTLTLGKTDFGNTAKVTVDKIIDDEGYYEKIPADKRDKTFPIFISNEDAKEVLSSIPFVALDSESVAALSALLKENGLDFKHFYLLNTMELQADEGFTSGELEGDKVNLVFSADKIASANLSQVFSKLSGASIVNEKKSVILDSATMSLTDFAPSVTVNGLKTFVDETGINYNSCYLEVSPAAMDKIWSDSFLNNAGDDGQDEFDLMLPTEKMVDGNLLAGLLPSFTDYYEGLTSKDKSAVDSLYGYDNSLLLVALLFFGLSSVLLIMLSQITREHSCRDDLVVLRLAGYPRKTLWLLLTTIALGFCCFSSLIGRAIAFPSLHALSNKALLGIFGFEHTSVVLLDFSWLVVLWGLAISFLVPILLNLFSSVIWRGNIAKYIKSNR